MDSVPDGYLRSAVGRDGLLEASPWVSLVMADDQTTRRIELVVQRSGVALVTIEPASIGRTPLDWVSREMPDGSWRKLGGVTARFHGGRLRLTGLPPGIARLSVLLTGHGAGQVDLQIHPATETRAFLAVPQGRSNLRVRIPLPDRSRDPVVRIYRLCNRGDAHLSLRKSLLPDAGHPQRYVADFQGLPDGEYAITLSVSVGQATERLPYSMTLDLAPGENLADLPALPAKSVRGAVRRFTPETKGHPVFPLSPHPHVGLKPVGESAASWFRLVPIEGEAPVSSGRYEALMWSWPGTTGSDGKSYRRWEMEVGDSADVIQVTRFW